MPQLRTLLLEGAWGYERKENCNFSQCKRSPRGRKDGQSSPVMLVSRLTINVARNSLSLATALRFRQDGFAGETIFLQWRNACWND
jgi:hypothetical protein